MELYLVRHGQSESNVGIDVEDPRLTETGVRQAELLGRRLRDVRFDRVFTSHLTRAIQTAAIVLRQQTAPPPIEVVPELTECGDRDFVSDAAHIRRLYGDLQVFGVASRPFSDNAARAAFCLENCVFQPAYSGMDHVSRDGEGEITQNDKNVLIVAHGMFNAHLIGQLVNFPFDKNMVVSQYNACLNCFQLYCMNGVRRVRFRSFNDVSHLPETLWT